MMTKVEAAKEWVVRTKEEVRELERVKEMIGNFIEVFEFLPDELEWKTDCNKRVLTAKAVEEPEETQTILG